MYTENDWIVVNSTTDDEVLISCWRHLPFEVNYDDFRHEMFRLKRHHQRYKITKITLWCLESIWALSGYASTLFTLSDYKMFLIQMLMWVIKSN